MTLQVITMSIIVYFLIDDIFQLRTTLKRDRQLAASGEDSLGRSTYYILFTNFGVLLALGVLAYFLVPTLEISNFWLIILLMVVLNIAIKYLAIFIQTLFVFGATRYMSAHYKKEKGNVNEQHR